MTQETTLEPGRQTRLARIKTKPVRSALLNFQLRGRSGTVYYCSRELTPGMEIPEAVKVLQDLVSLASDVLRDDWMNEI